MVESAIGILRNILPDDKAKLTRIRKDGKAGGTQAYYPLT